MDPLDSPLTPPVPVTADQSRHLVRERLDAAADLWNTIKTRVRDLIGLCITESFGVVGACQACIEESVKGYLCEAQELARGLEAEARERVTIALAEIWRVAQDVGCDGIDWEDLPDLPAGHPYLLPGGPPVGVVGQLPGGLGFCPPPATPFQPIQPIPGPQAPVTVGQPGGLVVVPLPLELPPGATATPGPGVSPTGPQAGPPPAGPPQGPLQGVPPGTGGAPSGQAPGPLVGPPGTPVGQRPPPARPPTGPRPPGPGQAPPAGSSAPPRSPPPSKLVQANGESTCPPQTVEVVCQAPAGPPPGAGGAGETCGPPAQRIKPGPDDLLSWIFHDPPCPSPDPLRAMYMDLYAEVIEAKSIDEIDSIADRFAGYT